eukprot:6759504-Karenia_brevis.AAC.1
MLQPLFKNPLGAGTALPLGTFRWLDNVAWVAIAHLGRSWDRTPSPPAPTYCIGAAITLATHRPLLINPLVQ